MNEFVALVDFDGCIFDLRLMIPQGEDVAVLVDLRSLNFLVYMRRNVRDYPEAFGVVGVEFAEYFGLFLECVRI
jgi:hypothetical protein